MYDYHTDNDNSSIECSDAKSSNTVPGLLERRRDDSSSDEDSVYCQDHDCDHPPATAHSYVLQSIDTRPIVPPLMYVSMDKDDYDADRDDDNMSTQARGTIATLRMQGGGIPVVETVTEEDMGEGMGEVEQPQPT